jgi:glycolate oxidase
VRQFNSDEMTCSTGEGRLRPAGPAQPGKNIPTLHRCAEFGALHVHHGQLPFPDLERF